MGILETAPFRLGSNYPVTCIDKSQIESPSLFIFLKFRPLGKTPLCNALNSLPKYNHSLTQELNTV